MICKKHATLFLLMSACAFGFTAPKHGHRRVDPRLFLPSVDAAVRQSEFINTLGLTRIRDDRELQGMVATGQLIPLTPGPGLRIDPRLPENRRYVRPWTRDVIYALSAEFNARFSAQLTVTSAVRPESVQKRLRRVNRNAAPATGDRESSHTTGATVDVSRRGLTREQTRFLEGLLLPLVLGNRAVVIEERGQPCFHIFVMPEAQ